MFFNRPKYSKVVATSSTYFRNIFQTPDWKKLFILITSVMILLVLIHLESEMSNK